MTYREAIQKMVKDVDNIYSDAGVLRDSATGKEKEVFNEVRTQTRNLFSLLNKFDNQLPDDRAHMEI
jgi:hypothetical protein